jgi:DNA repair protein RadC
MPINDWPEAERPREKLMQKGAAALSDAELLAIFLRTGTRNHTAVDIGRRLLDNFNGLRGLLTADQQQVCQQPGLGLAKYAQLQAVLELGRRHMAETLERGDALSDPGTTCRYLMARLRDYPHEVFACLFLDTRHRVIAFEELFYGTINGASVHPREVVKRCLAHNAAAVILAHNHPSGVAEPSQADIKLTQRLSEALALIDVRVLDHIIIGDGESTALAERGLI